MPKEKVKFQSRITADWDAIPTLEGRNLGFGKLEVEGQTRRFMLLDTIDGEVTVFESEGLKEGFGACDLGDYIRINFMAMVETKGGRSFRKFRVKVWSDSEAPTLRKVDVMAGFKRAAKVK
jgi:hypothetical protein